MHLACHYHKPLDDASNKFFMNIVHWIKAEMISIVILNALELFTYTKAFHQMTIHIHLKQVTIVSYLHCNHHCLQLRQTFQPLRNKHIVCNKTMNGSMLSILCMISPFSSEVTYAQTIFVCMRRSIMYARYALLVKSLKNPPFIWSRFFE